jgi:hypothetical protein
METFAQITGAPAGGGIGWTVAGMVLLVATGVGYLSIVAGVAHLARGHASVARFFAAIGIAASLLWLGFAGILAGLSDDPFTEMLAIGHQWRSPSFWLVALPGLVGLGVWWWAKKREIKPGCCRQCGYDLRGSMHNSYCPECGKCMTDEEKQNWTA